MTDGGNGATRRRVLVFGFCVYSLFLMFPVFGLLVMRSALAEAPLPLQDVPGPKAEAPPAQTVLPAIGPKEVEALRDQLAQAQSVAKSNQVRAEAAERASSANAEALKAAKSAQAKAEQDHSKLTTFLKTAEKKALDAYLSGLRPPARPATTKGAGS